jgi:hypothetical protein
VSFRQGCVRPLAFRISFRPGCGERRFGRSEAFEKARISREVRAREFQGHVMADKVPDTAGQLLDEGGAEYSVAVDRESGSNADSQLKFIPYSSS